MTSASFDIDIQNFVRSQEKDSKSFFSEDPELDSLVRSLVWKKDYSDFHNVSSERGLMIRKEVAGRL